MRERRKLLLGAGAVVLLLAACGGETIGDGSEGQGGLGSGSSGQGTGTGLGSGSGVSSGGFGSSGVGATASSSAGFGSGGSGGTASGGSSGIGYGSSSGVPFDAGVFDASFPVVDASSPVFPEDVAVCTGPSWYSYCVELVDDLEGDTGFLPPVSGRDGPWYTYNDGTAGGMQVPPPWPASAFIPVPTAPAFSNPVTGAMSAFSAETSGSGFTTWGAGMGFEFVLSDAQGKPRPYDAHGYKGVLFWARTTAGEALDVRVTLSDANTNSSVGACGASSECDAFGIDIEPGPDWIPFPMMFADMRQESWGIQYQGLDASALYTMNFQVSPGVTFDVAVDDIYFVLAP